MSAHERENRNRKSEKRGKFDVSNTNAYYIYNHYAYYMFKMLII